MDGPRTAWQPNRRRRESCCQRQVRSLAPHLNWHRVAHNLRRLSHRRCADPPIVAHKVRRSVQDGVARGGRLRGRARPHAGVGQRQRGDVGAGCGGSAHRLCDDGCRFPREMRRCEACEECYSTRDAPLFRARCADPADSSTDPAPIRASCRNGRHVPRRFCGIGAPRAEHGRRLSGTGRISRGIPHRRQPTLQMCTKSNPGTLTKGELPVCHRSDVHQGRNHAPSHRIRSTRRSLARARYHCIRRGPTGGKSWRGHGAGWPARPRASRRREWLRRIGRSRHDL